jgi:K+-transporting ATPase KdpF subunit
MIAPAVLYGLAAFCAIGLLAYLVYALVRAEAF